MTSIGHFGAIDDQTIRIRIFLGNRAVEVVEAVKVADAAMVNEAAAEVFKVWKSTSEVFKVIQILEFNNLRTSITLV